MSDVDEIKSRLNVVEIVGKRVALKKAGRNFKGLCPFHGEKTPSFMVSPDRAAWHCFGCGKGGSIIDFVMEYEHVDFVEALESLAQLAGVKLTKRIADSPEAKLKEQIFAINHLASEFFHYLLTKHKLGENAREYLKNRGVGEKLIKTFMLGYSPNSWEALYKFLRKKGYADELIEKAGLIIASHRPSSPSSNHFYDRFRGRLMFTLKDHRGNVVGFSGRVLDPTIKEAKYINSPETPVYSKSNVLYGLDITKEAINKSNEVILTEGEFDVISSFQAGISNVVAIKGSALTEGHAHLLKRFANKLIFALDGDLAGDAAARRGIELADKAGFEMKMVKLPSGKDPDEAARVSPALLVKAIKEAVPIYDYLIDSAINRFSPTSAHGKKQVANEVMPWLGKIENSIIQEHYLKYLARKLNTSEITLVGELRNISNKLNKGIKVESVVNQDSLQALTRLEHIEVYLLALLLQGETQDLFEELKSVVGVEQLSYLPIINILKRLEDYLPTVSRFLVRDFADGLPSELTRIVDQACLWDLSEIDGDSEMFAKEWTALLRELQLATLRQRIKITSKRIADTHEEDQEVIQKELRELTNKLKALENPN